MTLAVVIGFSLEVLGSGGSIVTLPVLVYVAGGLDWGLMMQFLGFAILGILGGIGLAHRLPENVLRQVFAIALIVIAVVIAGLNE